MDVGKKSLSAMLFMVLALAASVSSAQALGIEIILGIGGGGSNQGGGNSGGAPSPEVNAMLGLVLAGGVVAYLKRRKNDAKPE